MHVQQSQGLVSVTSNGSAIMKVDTTPVVSGGRKSVRIQSQFVFSGGLVLLDAVHMPTGCGTWPAFWSNGPNWPNNGEIDIVEGANRMNTNRMTLHANPGCMHEERAEQRGQTVGADCAAGRNSSEGCTVQDTLDGSFNVRSIEKLGCDL